MAITVTPNLTLVSNCDQTTGWAGGIAQFVLDTNVQVQGTGCLAAWIDNQLSAIQYYALPSAVNMSAAGHHVYIRMLVSNGQVDTKANGGYRVVMYSGLSNYATWYVGGNDTVESGWELFVVDPTSTPNATVGTFNPAGVTHIGVQFKTITAGKKQGQIFIYNVFWDIVRYGTGLTITSLATDEITLEEIYQIDFDTTNKYGVLQRRAGAYILNGKLTFGSVSSGSIDFVMNNEVLLCPNSVEVGENFNALDVLGNAGGTSNFKVSGSFIKANNRKITINLDKTNLDTVYINGTSITNADLDFGDISQDISGNVFNNCWQIVPKLSAFKDNVISGYSGSEGGALLFPSGVDNTARLTFNNNNNAIEIDTAGTSYIFNGHTFNGNTVDVNNTSGGSVTIAATNGANPNTTLGTVVINNAVTLTLINVIAGSEIRFMEHGTQNEVAGIEVSGTTFQYTYNYPTGFNVDIHILSLTYKKLWLDNIVLPSVSSELPVFQIIDRSYKA